MTSAPNPSSTSSEEHSDLLERMETYQKLCFDEGYYGSSLVLQEARAEIARLRALPSSDGGVEGHAPEGSTSAAASGLPERRPRDMEAAGWQREAETGRSPEMARVREQASDCVSQDSDRIAGPTAARGRAGVEPGPSETNHRVTLSGYAAQAAIDPTNHHNALKCPYCNPDGLVFAQPLPADDKGEAKPFLWICLVPGQWEPENIRAWTRDPDRAAQLVDDGLYMKALYAAPQPVSNAGGEAIQPHVYSPDYQAMGDCRVCGHGYDAAWHAPAAPQPRADASSEPETYRETVRKVAAAREKRLVQFREALESIAAWSKVNTQGEYEHGLRDIIRSLTDCAQAALEAQSASTVLSTPRATEAEGGK